MISVLITGVVNEQVDKDGGLKSFDVIIVVVPHK
jgi:hypothetical protein